MSAPTLQVRSDYVSAVAVELQDLAPEDRGELIEELDDHIAALLEDRPDADLVAELGSPRAYAAELRAAAGLTGNTAGPVSAGTRLVVLAARIACRIDDGTPGWLRSLVPDLRPIWWVLRGGVVAVVLVAVAHGGDTSDPGFLIPFLRGNRLLGGLFLLVCVLASVRLGRWGMGRRAGRWPLALLNAAVLLATAWAYVVASHGLYGDDGGSQAYYGPTCSQPLDNLYAYDSSGKPLSGVRLYDQNGTPFDVTSLGCGDGADVYTVNGVTAAPTGDAQGNVYPYTATATGGPSGPPPSLAPLPSSSPSSSPAPSSSGTPSPTG